nr:2-dehydro-3-deoxygalactonokinase [Neomicrococcus lactis]
MDWGTSSFRAYLLGSEGQVLETRSGGRGVLAVTTDVLNQKDRTVAFVRELETMCGDWLQDNPGLPMIACGMVGSNQGWTEVDYRTIPSNLLESSASLTSVSTPYGPLWIIPGLLKEGQPGSIVDLPDVMRGEETQLLGALPQADAGDDPYIVVLPGTHTKWVRLSGSVVTDFGTSMTGELYDLLVRHSILGRLAETPEQPNEAAFLRGLDVAFGTQEPRASPGGEGILATLFSARTLVMTGNLDALEVHDYISGLLIGAEIVNFSRRWMNDGNEGVQGPTPVSICANTALTRRYGVALNHAGITPSFAHRNAAARGLWLAALATGLTTKENI